MPGHQAQPGVQQPSILDEFDSKTLQHHLVRIIKNLSRKNRYDGETLLNTNDKSSISLTAIALVIIDELHYRKQLPSDFDFDYIQWDFYPDQPENFQDDMNKNLDVYKYLLQHNQSFLENVMKQSFNYSQVKGAISKQQSRTVRLCKLGDIPPHFDKDYELFILSANNTYLLGYVDHDGQFKQQKLSDELLIAVTDHIDFCEPENNSAITEGELLSKIYTEANQYGIDSKVKIEDEDLALITDLIEPKNALALIQEINTRLRRLNQKRPDLWNAYQDKQRDTKRIYQEIMKIDLYIGNFYQAILKLDKNSKEYQTGIMLAEELRYLSKVSYVKIQESHAKPAVVLKQLARHINDLIKPRLNKFSGAPKKELKGLKALVAKLLSLFNTSKSQQTHTNKAKNALSDITNVVAKKTRPKPNMQNRNGNIKSKKAQKTRPKTRWGSGVFMSRQLNPFINPSINSQKIVLTS